MKKDTEWKAIYESLLSDFNNIESKITSIIGFSDVLREKLPEDPEMDGYLETVIKEAKDVDLMLQCIKGGGAAGLPTESTDVDVRVIVDERISDLRSYLESKKVEIENQVPRDTRVRMAEKHAVSIVGNLLRNSVFHRGEWEKVLVYAEREPLLVSKGDIEKEYVVFHSRDMIPGNGVKGEKDGIKATTEGNVIIPQKEYGFGIYIAGKIARLYGGDLEISTGKGYRDSVVTLPLYAGD